MTRAPESLAAWILLPVVLYAIGLGVGLLARRLSGIELPNALLTPVGAVLGIVLVMAPYKLGIGAIAATPLLAAAAVAGFVLEWRAGRLRASINPGPAGIGALGVYLVYLAPVFLSGAWTWAGYNFVNDTAVQLLLADHLRHEGLTSPDGGTTTLNVVQEYLKTGYPTGSHGLLAALGPLVPADLAALYQPYISALAALAAMAMACLAARAGLRPWIAALAGFAAMLASLTYNYALHGSVKELAMLLGLATAVAVAREAAGSARVIGTAALLGLCLGGCVLIFSAAALPYVGLVAVGAGVLLTAPRDSAFRQPRRLAVGLAVGTPVVVLASLPVLAQLFTFEEVASDAFADEGAREHDFGHLLGQIDLLQAAGVWLGPDYRVAPEYATLTDVLLWLVMAAAVFGVVTLAKRREWGVLLLAGSALLVYFVMRPRLSPYTDAKLLVVLSPAIVLAAAVGLGRLAMVARRAALPAAAGAAVLLGGLIWSDAEAYHNVQLAPVDRMLAMQDVAKRYEKSESLLLVHESEEFAKYFMREAPINDHYEPITIEHVVLRGGGGFRGLFYDLDFVELEYLQKWRYLVQRRSPAASRPPLNWELDYENEYYLVWTPTAPERVYHHLPIAPENRAGEEFPCDDIKEFAAIEPDKELVALALPEVVTFDTATAERTAGWINHPFVPNAVQTTTPGSARAELDFRGARYTVWVQGSFGRWVTVKVDGETVGRVKGVQPRGQWHRVGEVELSAGSHDVELQRPGGGFSPGDGFQGFLGPIAFRAMAESTPLRVPSNEAERACGLQLDWLELVEPR